MKTNYNIKIVLQIEGKELTNTICVTDCGNSLMETINNGIKELEDSSTLNIGTSDSDYCYYFPVYSDRNNVLVQNCFPYILLNGVYEWNVPFEDVSINDYIITHDIKPGGTIEVSVSEEYGFGDNIFIEILNWVLLLKGVIDLSKDLKVIASEVMALAQGLMGRNKEYVDPLDAIEVLRKKEEWTVSDVKKVFNLNKEAVASILLENAGFTLHQDGVYKKASCTDAEFEYYYFDKLEKEEKNTWGDYSALNKRLSDLSISLFDLNKHLTNLYFLSVEMNSREYEKIAKKVDSFIKKNNKYVLKGEQFEYIKISNSCIPDNKLKKLENSIIKITGDINGAEIRLLDLKNATIGI